MHLSKFHRAYAGLLFLTMVFAITVPVSNAFAQKPLPQPLPQETPRGSSGQGATQPSPGGNKPTTGLPSPGGNTGGSVSSSGGSTIANPLKFSTLEELLNAILDAAIKLGTVILTLALIYTGFLFVAARGNEAQLTKAKQALLYTIIGGLILLGAKAIETVISDTVNSLHHEYR